MANRSREQSEYRRRMVRFRNDEGSLTVPAFGVMKVTGIVGFGDAGDDLVYKIEQNGTTLNPELFLINSHVPVAAGAFGLGSFDPVGLVRFDDAATPAFGQGWGVPPESWEIEKGYPGFVILGEPDSDVVPRVVARQYPVVERWFQLSEDFSSGAADAQSQKNDGSGDYEDDAYDETNIADKGFTTLDGLNDDFAVARYHFELSDWVWHGISCSA